MYTLLNVKDYLSLEDATNDFISFLKPELPIVSIASVNNSHYAGDIYFHLYHKGLRIGGAGLIRRDYGFYIYGVKIYTQFQDKGYGHILMQSVIDCTSQISDVSELVLEVWYDNWRARHLYSKFGFRFVNRDGEAITMKRKSKG